MSALSGPQDAFSVGGNRVGDATLSLEQHVGAGLLDHRGRIEIPAYAVMAESVTSGVYWYSFSESVATVQAWLAMTAGAPVAVGDTLRATAALSHHDERYGTATVAVRNQTGDTVCTGVARAVRVGRSTPQLERIDRDRLAADGAAAPVRPAVSSAAPEPDPGWSGARVLSAMHSGALDRGPLCELLAMTIERPTGDPVLAVDPQPWMANPLGAIQGGVIAAIAGQACSLAGQAHTGPDDRYWLADLCVHYFRSPPVDAGALTLVTETERAGRRLATVTATMTGAAGERYARAVADIAYQRADAF